MRFAENTGIRIRECSSDFYEIMMDRMKESKFTFGSISNAEQDELYQNFYNSYVQSVGSAWDRQDFEWKSSQWTFWGSPQGGVALRHQNSGMWKLNASYGSPKAIFNGLKEMVNDIGDEPIWGAMTDNIAVMLEKATARMGNDKMFLRVPKLIAKVIVPHIKKVFGDNDKIEVNSDGTLSMQAPDGTAITKVLIANRSYYKHMIDEMENNPDKLPIPVLVQKGIIGTLKLFYRKYFK